MYCDFFVISRDVYEKKSVICPSGWSAHGKFILVDPAFPEELGHILLDDDNDDSSDEGQKNLVTVVNAAGEKQA